MRAPPGHPIEVVPHVLQDRVDRPVVRLGDRVRYPREPWSASVHALLGYLREAGFAEAPSPVALTETYDEVGFIAGVSGDEACLLVDTDEAVAAVALLLRRYHDLVAEWRPEVATRWFDGQTGTGDGRLLVTHGDPAPWNLVWRDGRLVGLIDWEYATLGTRRADIGYALHYLVPFRDRSYWQGVLGMSRKPRRQHRLAVFAEAYGIPVDETLVDDVLTAQRAGVQLMIDMAARGSLRYERAIADGELERERRSVLWGEGHRHLLLPRLR